MGGRDLRAAGQGDQELEYGLFVEVMDAVRETGSHRIVLSAEVKKKHDD